MRIVRSRTVPPDLRSALRTDEMASALRASGQQIGFADCLQAGTCLRHRLPFVMRTQALQPG